MTNLAVGLGQITKETGAEWSMSGDVYENLVWLSDSEKPSETDIAAAEQRAYKVAADKEAADKAARNAAIAHAKSLGFTDEMISVMYPNLAT